MKYLYLLILSLLAVYTLVCVYVYINQRNLLYHPAENNYSNDEINFDYEEVWIKTKVYTVAKIKIIKYRYFISS